MAHESDSELMVRFQDGNIHAFELLFERYRNPVFSFLFRMLNRRQQESEDLLQEVFLKLLKAKDFYEPREAFSTWLFTIARNHCLNYIKSRQFAQASRSVPLEAAPAACEAPVDPSTGSLPSVAREVEDREFQECLEQAVACLTPEYREVFLLHAVQGHSHEEIARMLRMNPATVRTHYHRARLMLRSKIAAPLAGKERKP